MSVIKSTPDLDELFEDIRTFVQKIQSGQRVQVLVPKEYSHEENERDWGALGDLQVEFSGPNLPPNVFVTLRFDQKSEGEVYVDIYHL